MGALVTVERDDAVAVVTMNRPPMNALDARLVSELDGAIAQLETDDAVRAVVVYGGAKTFSAGADLEEMAEGGPDDVRRRVGALGAMISRLERLPIVTIAAITGYALGGGCEITLGCDLRVAAQRARIGQPEIKVGLIPGAGGTQRLPRLVGLGRARWMIYTGDFVDAPTALDWGLVDVLADGDVLQEAVATAARFASGPTKSLAAAKRALATDLAPGLARELDGFVALFDTEDTRHGIESFNADGPGKARFTGR